MKKSSSLLRLSIRIIVSLFTIVYLLSCLTPYISPLYFRGFTYLALVFPWLLIGMLIILLMSIFLFRKYSLLLFLILLIDYKNIFSTTGFHFQKPFVEQQAPNTFRLLSWNVDDFITSSKKLDNFHAPRRNILSLIKTINADVICFQDFATSSETKYEFSNLKYLLDTLNYHYHYISVDDTSKGRGSKYGTIILSKYPIIDTGRFVYARKHLPEHLMYATININGKPIRFYNTHLQSMYLHRYGRTDYNNEQFIEDDTAIIYTGNSLQKLVYFDSIHVHQARLIKTQLNKCPLPYIFCADLNSVPSSYVYQHISDGLTDAFLQNGSGWSATYSEISPTLRIDVVLFSKDLNSIQYYSPKIQNASDHYPIVTDIAIH